MNAVPIEADALPEGWTGCVLRDVMTNAIGGEWGLPSEQADGKSLIEAAVIRGTEFRSWDKDKGATAARRAIPERKLPGRRLEEGDLVLEVSGGGPQQPVGRTILIDRLTLDSSSLPLTCSNFCRRIQLSKCVDPGFVWWALRSLYARGHLDQYQTQTTNLRNLNVTDFLDGLQIAIAPQAEQTRIVAKVEELLARMNAARERLAIAPTILKRFRQSILAAACSGQLTANWRESHECEPIDAALARTAKGVDPKAIKHLVRRGTDGIPEAELPELPSTWIARSVRHLVEVGAILDFQDGNHGSLYPRATDFGDKGIKFLTAAQVFDNRVLLDETPLLKRDKAKLLRIGFALPDDVLLTHNATVGRVAILPQYDGDVILGTSVTYYRTNRDAILPQYLCYFMQGQFWQDQLRSVMEQTTRNQVSVTKQVEFQVVLPPVEEQQEIIRHVKALFALADKIESRVQAATVRVEKIMQAILAKAFRGELVPTEAELARQENRAYEPAAALLARIQAARSATAPTAAKRPRPRKSASRP